MSYCVYKHTFPNDKVYIGITSKKPEDRWNKGKGYVSQPKMISAILDYGWDNVKHEILYDGLSKEEAEQIEANLISKYQSNSNEYGYNVTNIVDKTNHIDSYVYKPEGGYIFPNQKVVKINKSKSNNNDMYDAMKNLSGNEFKLYMYLCDNKNGDIFALSRTIIVQKTGMSVESYKNAVNELINKKYLVCKQGNSYDFYTTSVTTH